MTYTIVVKKTEHGFSAHVPELPGCVAAAETRDETVELLRAAIELHLESIEGASNLRFDLQCVSHTGRNTSYLFVRGERQFQVELPRNDRYVSG